MNACMSTTCKINGPSIIKLFIQYCDPCRLNDRDAWSIFVRVHQLLCKSVNNAQFCTKIYYLLFCLHEKK